MPTFPTFANGVVSGLPYGETDLFTTTQSFMPCGVTYTMSWNPAAQQRAFLVQFQMITRPEMKTLEDFWTSMNGNSGRFSFIDDQLRTHTNCRFDQDSIEYQYVEPGQYATQVRVLALD